MGIVGPCQSGSYVRKMALAQARCDGFAGWYEQWGSGRPPLIEAQDGLGAELTGVNLSTEMLARSDLRQLDGDAQLR